MSTPICTLPASAYSCRGRVALNAPPGELDHLERADDPAAVVGKDLRGGGGIDLGQAAVQRRRPEPRELGLELTAQVGVGARELEAVQHGPRVESRAADEDGRPASPPDLGDRGAGPALEVRDGERLAHVEQVEQVVGDASALRGGDLGRADVHAAVDRHRVGVDDLAPQPLRQVEGQPVLPAAVAPTTATIGGTGARHGVSLAGALPAGSRSRVCPCTACPTTSSTRTTAPTTTRRRTGSPAPACPTRLGASG